MQLCQITRMTMGDEFDAEEREAINELRNRMKDDMEPEMLEDDYVFHRFLTVQDFNVDNAEIMLKKNLKWREKHDLKNIMNFKKTEFMEKYLTFTNIGHDKEGRVVRYSAIGNMDVKGVLSSMTGEELMRYTIYEVEVDLEELRKRSQKLGRNVDKFVYIYNFDKLTFAKVTDKQGIYALIGIVSMYINNYPERLNAIYIFNVSMYFTMMFTALKSILPKTILDKIRLYSDDSYKEDLLKVIDADVLPAFLGGTRTDPDGNPLCLTFINHGETVPQKYYLSRRREALSKAADCQKVTLSNAAFQEVSLEVKLPGSYLEWEFETKCRDVGFGLFHQDGEQITEIVPIQRIDTELYPETGTFRCDEAGTYVIVFDNTYSWVRAKEIYYRVKVVSPEESAEMVEDLNH